MDQWSSQVCPYLAEISGLDMPIFHLTSIEEVPLWHILRDEGWKPACLNFGMLNGLSKNSQFIEGFRADTTRWSDGRVQV